MEESDRRKTAVHESIDTDEQMKVHLSTTDKTNESSITSAGKGLKRSINDVKQDDGSASSNDGHDREDNAPSTDTSAVPTGIVGSGDATELDEHARLEERRAYNRRNAARSRQRVKDQLRDLQQQVIAHNATRSELERTNVRLLAENNVLRDEVQKLRTILSGAPLFGQQSQPLQPFMQQQLSMGFNPTAPFVQQGVSQPQSSTRSAPTTLSPVSQQPMTQMYHNVTQQQSPVPNFYPSTAQVQGGQLDLNSSLPQFPSSQLQMPPSVGDSNNVNNQSNAVVQLLLQQLMNTNNNATNIAAQFPSNATQTQPNQLQAQMQQPDGGFAAFMAMVGGNNTNAAVSSTTGQQLQQTSTSASMTLPETTTDTQIQPLSLQSNISVNSIQQQQQYDQRKFQEMSQSLLLQQQQQQQFGQQESKNELYAYKSTNDNVGSNTDKLGG